MCVCGVCVCVCGGGGGGGCEALYFFFYGYTTPDITNTLNPERMPSCSYGYTTSVSWLKTT